MKRSTVVLLKAAVWIACLWPIGLLVWGAVTPAGLGPDPTAHIALTTGYTTLMLLTITLAITPVRKLVPRLGWLARFRRLVGLFAFFYATVHMLTWVALYNYFSLHAMAEDIAKRKFITMGVCAFLLLLPLALTSTNWAIRKMGGKRWNRLHKLVYLAAVCGVIHYWWQVKTGVLLPLPFTIAVTVLLAARPLLAWRQRRKLRPAALV
ncbi:MAG TPA: protein-methionine-sulfoxide reductase heme-binding subunit MsrQ [Candidatus Saccharimonadales bacterium]|nr:protein-methionine-sulfoxide reductase heme-binding subunit MsrQ [Candidatus Saccharimonadales bacterium]